MLLPLLLSGREFQGGALDMKGRSSIWAIEEIKGHGDILVYPGAFIDLLLGAIHGARCWEHMEINPDLSFKNLSVS